MHATAWQDAMTSLTDIQKHVLDDAVELIATIGVATPLVSTTIAHEMGAERQKIALFLRSALSRHVILVVIRLHRLDEQEKQPRLTPFLIMLN